MDMIDPEPQKLIHMESAVIALFKDHKDVENAVKQLAEHSFDVTHIDVVGRGFHSEEHVTGFYQKHDRIMFWGKQGAFWGGLWGLLLGGLYITVPFVGPIIIVGHLAVIVASVLEGALVVGGLSALGAALYNMGFPKEDIIRYETAIKADTFLVMLHGRPSEIRRAKSILEHTNPTHLDVHHNVKVHLSEMDQNGVVYHHEQSDLVHNAENKTAKHLCTC